MLGAQRRPSRANSFERFVVDDGQCGGGGDDGDEDEWSAGGYPPGDAAGPFPPEVSADGNEMLLGGTAYFYLSTKLCMGEETMMRITFQHPTVLGLSVEDNIRPTLRFLAESLHLDGRAVVNICRLHPPLLHLNVDTNLRPTVGWFCKRLDLSPVQLGQIVAKFPSMLGYSIELNLEPKVAFLTRALALRAGKATLGAGVALSRSHSRTTHCEDDDGDLYDSSEDKSFPDLGFILERHPALFSPSLYYSMQPKVELVRRELGLDPLALQRLMLHRTNGVPQLLSYSLEDNLGPKIIFLRQQLGFSSAETSKLLRLAPKLITLSLDKRIIPLVSYLQSDLGMSPSETRRVLLRFPRLPSYNIESTLRPRVEFIRRTLFENGPHDASDAPEDDADSDSKLVRLLCMAPQLLGVRLEDKIKQLDKHLGWRLTDGSTLRRCAVGLPTMLTYSVEANLVPKIAFLCSVSGASREQVLQGCASRPIILGLSLDKRLRPRCHAIHRTLAPYDESDGSFECTVSLQNILTTAPMSSDRFEAWLAKQNSID